MVPQRADWRENNDGSKPEEKSIQRKHTRAILGRRIRLQYAGEQRPLKSTHDHEPEVKNHRERRGAEGEHQITHACEDTATEQGWHEPKSLSHARAHQ